MKQKQDGDIFLLQQVGISESGLNLGGLGTGGVELRPDGRFYEWNLVNTMPWSHHEKKPWIHAIEPVRPRPMDTDFFVRVQEAGRRPVYRWLFTGHGCVAGTASHFFRHHKYFMIRTVEAIRYRARYPFVDLEYVDREFPVEVRLRAWTSIIPRDVEASNLPGFHLDFTVRNRGKKRLDVSLVWQQQNLAGFAAEKRRQEHAIVRSGRQTIVEMRGSLDEPEHDTSGTLAMWAMAGAGQRVTAVAANPYMQNLIWPIHRGGDLEGPVEPARIAREELRNPPDADVPNKGWLCVRHPRLEAGAATELRLGLAWHFPHHRSIRGTRIGHVYATRFASAAEVARHLADRHDRHAAAAAVLPDLVEDSPGLPPALRAALLDQLSTLTKNSQFTEDGRFGVQEGHGCCAHNTVDVDHYAAYAPALLFPALRALVNDLTMEMAHPANGKAYHGFEGTMEKVEPGGERGYNRWDCSCQYVLQVYRDARWAGDRAQIERHWEACRRAMDLVIGMDFYGTGLPYTEGGITYDHWRMKGVVTYMAGVYLAALRAMEDMARLLGDAAAAARYRRCFEIGCGGFESLLWEGDRYLLYYARRPKDWRPSDEPRGHEGHLDPVRPAPALCRPSPLAPDGPPVEGVADGPPDWREVRDTGTMTDLLNGHATAVVMGLGGFLDPERVDRQLALILRDNLQPENDAVVNGSYPDESFPDEWPFMQWHTPWTGTEYFLALQLYAAGRVRDGDHVIDLVHRRHVREGMRFDHAEANNHYTRPLCIWGAYAARLGLDLDLLRGHLALRLPRELDGYRGLLATGTGLGRAELVAKPRGTRCTLALAEGRLALRSLTLRTRGLVRRAAVTVGGRGVEANLDAARGEATLAFARAVVLKPGTALEVELKA